MTDLLAEIVELMTGGLTSMATGIGNGLNSLITNLFVQTSSSGAHSLTTFGAVTIVFAGVALAIGLSRFVVNFVTKLGK